MDDLRRATPHLIMAAIAIVAIIILAIEHLIPGGEAFGGVMAASGFTLGVTGASSSTSVGATAVTDTLQSASTLVPAQTTPLTTVKSESTPTS